jgi:hypothetical protein
LDGFCARTGWESIEIGIGEWSPGRPSRTIVPPVILNYNNGKEDEAEACAAVSKDVRSRFSRSHSKPSKLQAMDLGCERTLPGPTPYRKHPLPFFQASAESANLLRE